MRIAVVGAGMAGLACGEALVTPWSCSTKAEA